MVYGHAIVCDKTILNRHNIRNYNRIIEDNLYVPLEIEPAKLLKRKQ
jgi:hypothetical protein